MKADDAQYRMLSWPNPSPELFQNHFLSARKTQFGIHPLTNAANEGVPKGLKLFFRLGSGKTGTRRLR